MSTVKFNHVYKELTTMLKSYLFYNIEGRRTLLNPFYNAKITLVPNSEWGTTEKKEKKII